MCVCVCVDGGGGLEEVRQSHSTRVSCEVGLNNYLEQFG
jgi:hypothetical protein